MASGQSVNNDKSSVFFSRNVRQEVKEEVCNVLHFAEAGDHTQYLGLPNMIGKNKSSAFGYLKDRMQQRVEGWDKRHLSKGGKEILLKSVAQAIPTYAMSIFLLPSQMCKDMEMIMSRYWWKSNSKKEKGMHWMCWERLCKKKSSGGLGFRDMRDFNLALLGKQGWRLITQPSSLVSRMYKARYYPNDTFLTAKIGSNPSFVWRSVLETQTLLKAGVARRVGTGNSISILEDPWLPSRENPYIHTDHAALVGNTVDSLMSMDNTGWDVELINDIFSSRDANLILSIPLQGLQEDSWYWRGEKMGFYSVKSAYATLRAQKEFHHSSDSSGFWRKLWNLKVPPKIKHFLWRAASGTLPTKDLLLSRRINVCGFCPVCNEANESVIHVLTRCSFAILCWDQLDWLRDGQEYSNFADWLNEVFQKCTAEEVRIVSMVCWTLWKNRNDIVWNQKSSDATTVVYSARNVLDQWQSAQDRSFDHSIGFMTLVDGNEYWKLPQINTVKINSDAALFEEFGRYSFALLARDHEGTMVEARACCRQGILEPEVAEAIGVREVLSWIKSMEWSQVIVETDCLTVIQAIRSSYVGLSYFGRIIDECKQHLSELQSRLVTINFIKRSANVVAHYLARSTSSLADRRWSRDDVYPDLSHVLLKDLIH